MSDPYVMPLETCSDRALVGGKAAGLGRLIRDGFQVPPGLCLTTAAYRDALRAGGVDPAGTWARLRRTTAAARPARLAEVRRRVESLPVPQPLLDALAPELDRLERAFGEPGGGVLWAVRSSSPDEDGEDATFGGLFRTLLAIPRGQIAEALVRCWASLWTPQVLAYRDRLPAARSAPAMAVVLQPLLAPRASGIASSRHPLTGDAHLLAVNAVFGLAEPLASGLVTPDEYLLSAEGDRVSLLDRATAEKRLERVATPAGLTDRPLPPEQAMQPVLSDDEAIALGRLAKRVERLAGKPCDIEWALDHRGFWLLQARGIPGFTAGASPAPIVWSRANFKETLPELPSPLALSFLRSFMESCIVRHYREAGCVIPSGMPSVSIIRGRPYINVTLLQAIMGQLRGDPRLVTEQMGGEPGPVPTAASRLPEARPLPPEAAPLPLLRFIRAVFILHRKVRGAARRAPVWFAELRRMGEAQADPERADDRTQLEESAALERVEALHRRLVEGDLTFGLVGGVSRGLYVLGATLARRMPEGWRPLLNAATRGLGTIVSANQILGLVELARIARDEPVARAFFLTPPWEPGLYRVRLAGTRVLAAFDRYLADYGHRAIGESDIMVPRFQEAPDALLGVIKGHLEAGAVLAPEDIRAGQEAARREALGRLRRAFGWRWHEWLWFRWWYRSLCRYLALREANRHHLMYYQACSRRLLLTLGDRLAACGVLRAAEDLFFLTPDEIRTIAPGGGPERGGTWLALVEARRAERERCATLSAPDTITGRPAGASPDEDAASPDRLTGIPISAGYVEGPVCLLLSPEDVKKIRKGDILVAPVIDPGMAPWLGIAAGLVAEMGGTLSHGAIIAREYGLPAVANVRGVTRLLKDGELIAVDATTGGVRRLDAC